MKALKSLALGIFALVFVLTEPVEYYHKFNKTEVEVGGISTLNVELATYKICGDRRGGVEHYKWKESKDANSIVGVYLTIRCVVGWLEEQEI